MLFHTQNNWINSGVNNEKIVRLDHLIKKHQLSNIYRIDNPNLFSKKNYFQFYDKKIAIIDNQYKIESSAKQIQCDLLIITKNANVELKKLTQSIAAKLVVIDASNSTNNRERWIDELILEKIPYWDVVEKGAFEIDLHRF